MEQRLKGGEGVGRVIIWIKSVLTYMESKEKKKKVMKNLVARRE